MNEGLNTLSAADVAAVTRNNDGNMWGDGGWFWIIILAFLFCGNGWGNNNGAQDAFISDEFVKRDIFNTNQNVSNTACETQRDVLEKPFADDCKSKAGATILFFCVLRKMERSTVLRHTRKCRYRDIKRGRRKVQIP